MAFGFASVKSSTFSQRISTVKYYLQLSSLHSRLLELPVGQQVQQPEWLVERVALGGQNMEDIVDQIEGSALEAVRHVGKHEEEQGAPGQVEPEGRTADDDNKDRVDSPEN